MDVATRPRRLTRAERKDQTRDALLRAAASVFMRFGYARATLDLVAADAGYTKGAIYANFENKESLFLELLAGKLERIIAQLDRIATDAASDPDMLITAMSEWIDFVDQRDDIMLLQLEVGLEARKNPAIAPRFDRLIGNYETSLAEILKRMYAALGWQPRIPVEELAVAAIVLSENVALARQTRKGASYSAGPAIRALAGLPPVDDIVKRPLPVARRPRSAS